MIRVSLLALVLALAAPASAQNRPSFDCAKASEGAEKAICKSASLSRLDRAISAAYAQARRKLDATGREALQEDQEIFLGSRESAIAEDAKSLGAFMRERLTLLNGLVTPQTGGGDAAFLGEWHDVSGFVRVTRAPGGKLKVFISTSTPVTGMRACGVEEIVEPKDGRLAFRRAEFNVTVERNGSMLKVTKDGDTSAACGHGSWLGGHYFRVNWRGKRVLPT
jgi:uncharacterized protein YecT (DUF1311 family)